MAGHGLWRVWLIFLGLLVAIVVVTTDSILVFALGSIFGAAAMVALKSNVETKVKERLKRIPKSDTQARHAAERPNDWLLGSILLYVISGLLILVFYYVNENTAIITSTAPQPTADILLYDFGEWLFFLGTGPLILVIIFIFRPHTRLVDYLTTRWVSKALGIFFLVATRGLFVAGVLTVEYVWARFLILMSPYFGAYGITALGVWWLVFYFSLVTSFIGASVLVVFMLPIGPTVSRRASLISIALWAFPLVVLIVGGGLSL